MTHADPHFAAALLDPAAAVPQGLVTPEGAPATRRFDVYRNNVAVGLSDALEAAFPILRALVGEAFFRAMAGVFFRAHPPRSPLMMFYGEAMPGFLEAFPPVAHLPYLPDVARLELALRESYHAADATPLPPEALARVAAEALPALRFTFAPALRVVASAYPIHGIYRAHADGAPPPAPGGETVLVTRPGFDPECHALTPPAAAALAILREGGTLGAAAEVPGLDLPALLGLLLGQGAILSHT